MAITTLTDYLSWAGMTGTDPARDATLTAILAASEDAVKRYLNCNIEKAQYTVYIDAPPSRTLQLAQIPVHLEGLQVFSRPGSAGDPNDFIGVPPLKMYVDYALDVSDSEPHLSHTGILRSLRGFWGVGFERPYYSLANKLVPLRQTIKVIYTAGYDPIPPSLIAAVHLLATKIYHMRRRGGPFQAESLAGYSYSMSSAALALGILDGDPTIRSLLHKFGRPIVVASS